MAPINGDNNDNILDGTSGDDQIYGYDGNDTLDGKAGNDDLYAGAGNDTLIGGDGVDFLDGGAGVDVMTGGLGNDGYVVDDAGDSVNEAFGEGSDTVKSFIDYVLTANVENLQLIGDVDGTGNALNNSIAGSNDGNTIRGGDGNDSISGYGGNDFIYGGNGNDYLRGGDGIDTLHYGDVSGPVTISLSAVGYQNTGGSAGSDNIAEFENIFGSAGNDTLTGDGGNNDIDGSAGDDWMAGLGGDDQYSVDDAGDVIVEGVGEGTDLVFIHANHTMEANLENMVVVGAVTGTGNSLANIIVGDGAANVIEGKGGTDSIAGGLGADTFILDGPTGTSADDISDFATGLDIIQVHGSDYGLTAGALNPALFIVDAAPATTDGQFLFNSVTGDLNWDANGSVAGGVTLIADFNGQSVVATDIVVI